MRGARDWPTLWAMGTRWSSLVGAEGSDAALLSGSGAVGAMGGALEGTKHGDGARGAAAATEASGSRHDLPRRGHDDGSSDAAVTISPKSMRMLEEAEARMHSRERCKR